MSRRHNEEPSIRKQARNAVLRTILFSPQSISIILLSLALFALNISFLGQPAFVWILFGLLGELVYFGASISDPQTTTAIVSKMLDRRYDPSTIKNSRSRQRLQQALEYYQNMQEFAQQHSGAMRVQIASTLSEVDDWISQIYKLARRIDLYEENELLARDRMRAPDELAKLQRRLKEETDDYIRSQLEDAIELKETHLNSLKTLEINIKRANIQLENTLSALGTIYAQMQVMDSKDVGSRRSHRLRQEIHDEVLSLRDTIEAIDDVQSNSLYAISQSQ